MTITHNGPLIPLTLVANLGALAAGLDAARRPGAASRPSRSPRFDRIRSTANSAEPRVGIQPFLVTRSQARL